MDAFRQREQKLDRLLQSLTPAQRNLYKARIDKLKRDAELKRMALSLPANTESKKKVNDARKDKLGDKLIDASKIADIKNSFKKGDIGDIVKHHHANIYNAVNKGVKANTKEVTSETSDKAVLTRAGTLYAREGQNSARGYLSQMGCP